MKDGNLVPLMLRRAAADRALKRRAFDAQRFLYGFAMVAGFFGCILMAIVAFGDWR